MPNPVTAFRSLVCFIGSGSFIFSTAVFYRLADWRSGRGPLQRPLQERSPVVRLTEQEEWGSRNPMQVETRTRWSEAYRRLDSLIRFFLGSPDSPSRVLLHRRLPAELVRATFRAPLASGSGTVPVKNGQSLLKKKRPNIPELLAGGSAKSSVKSVQNPKSKISASN